MNILYLADPNSIHDIKWITNFNAKYTCYLISRNVKNHLVDEVELTKQNIQYLGSVNDFSTVRFWENFAQIKKIKKWVKLEKISLIHILYTEPNILWANFRNYLGVPIIATSRGSDILITIKNTINSNSVLNYFVGKLYKRAFRKCGNITSTSNAQLNDIVSLGVNKNNITIVRTGIDTNEIESQLKHEVAPQSSEAYILFPRNMSPVYNHELSIEAIRLLPPEIKKKYAFIFLDSDSSSKGYVRKIKKMIMESPSLNIKFLQRLNQPSLWNHLKNARLVIMTNLSDGTPVTAMETMYLKTPLMLSPLQYDEDIFHSVPTFPNFNPDSLAKSILKQIEVNDSKNLEIGKQSILTKCNRRTEMNKMDIIYISLKIKEEN